MSTNLSCNVYAIDVHMQIRSHVYRCMMSMSACGQFKVLLHGFLILSIVVPIVQSFPQNLKVLGISFTFGTRWSFKVLSSSSHLMILWLEDGFKRTHMSLTQLWKTSWNEKNQATIKRQGLLIYSPHNSHYSWELHFLQENKSTSSLL